MKKTLCLTLLFMLIFCILIQFDNAIAQDSDYDEDAEEEEEKDYDDEDDQSVDDEDKDYDYSDPIDPNDYSE